MEVFECIKTRRSVRRFEDRPVDHEVIRKAVDAAVWAPSWKNTQTPRYTVTDSREIIDDIAANGCCGFEFNSKTLRQTPVLIAVSYVKGRCGFERDGSYSTDKKEGWQMFDAGIYQQKAGNSGDRGGSCSDCGRLRSIYAGRTEAQEQRRGAAVSLRVLLMPRMRNRYNENACTDWNFRKTEQTAVWAFCCFRECVKRIFAICTPQEENPVHKIGVHYCPGAA